MLYFLASLATVAAFNVFRYITFRTGGAAYGAVLRLPVRPGDDRRAAHQARAGASRSARTARRRTC